MNKLSQQKLRPIIMQTFGGKTKGILVFLKKTYKLESTITNECK